MFHLKGNKKPWCWADFFHVTFFIFFQLFHWFCLNFFCSFVFCFKGFLKGSPLLLISCFLCLLISSILNRFIHLRPPDESQEHWNIARPPFNTVFGGLHVATNSDQYLTLKIILFWLWLLCRLDKVIHCESVQGKSESQLWLPFEWVLIWSALGWYVCIMTWLWVISWK